MNGTRLAFDNDLNTTQRLTTVLEGLVGRERPRVILDLSRVSHVSSVGWGTLLKLSRQARESGGEIKLAAMSDRIMKIFQLLELGHELASTADVEQALAAFPE